MRKLSSKELYDGVYVQCGSPTVYPTVYQIIIREDKYFYKEINKSGSNNLEDAETFEEFVNQNPRKIFFIKISNTSINIY